MSPTRPSILSRLRWHLLLRSALNEPHLVPSLGLQKGALSEIIRHGQFIRHRLLPPASVFIKCSLRRRRRRAAVLKEGPRPVKPRGAFSPGSTSKSHPSNLPLKGASDTPLGQVYAVRQIHRLFPNTGAPHGCRDGSQPAPRVCRAALLGSFCSFLLLLLWGSPQMSERHPDHM